ncbi:hypothetical protein PCANB_001026 [Pneumocystis canis]|nr:hypothetical protein PCANB_001026 [Pneumocystis canis]
MRLNMGSLLIESFINFIKKNDSYYYMDSILLNFWKKRNKTYILLNYNHWTKRYVSNTYSLRKDASKLEKKTKYPDLYKTVAEPKSENLKHKTDTLKHVMANLRRQYLTEYVMEQKKNDLKKKIKEQEIFEAKKPKISANEKYLCYTPTIRSLLEDEYPLADPNKLDRINRKIHNFEMMKKKNQENRLYHFLTLYSHSEKFISTIKELDDAVNKYFQEVPTGLPPGYNIQFLQNQKEKSSSKSSHSVPPEIFDALLGTVDGGKLGPDELIEINNTHNTEKLNNKD